MSAEDRVQWHIVVLGAIAAGLGVVVIVGGFVDPRWWLPFIMTPLGLVVVLCGLSVIGEGIPKTDAQIEAEIRDRLAAMEQQRQSRRGQIAARVIREDGLTQVPR